MAIDISREHVITFLDATKHLPPRRRGKRPNVASIYRWAAAGVRGIRLEFLLVGGTRCTSVEALQRFFDSLTAAADNRPQAPQRLLTVNRQRQIEVAERRLAKAGISKRTPTDPEFAILRSAEVPNKQEVFHE